MYIGGVLIPADLPVNGTTIARRMPRATFRCPHIELDERCVAFADGAPSQAFVPEEGRGHFHDGAEFAAPYPGAPDGACGRALAAVRARLRHGAAA